MKTNCVLFAGVASLLLATLSHARNDLDVPGGRLDAIGPKGQDLGACPLKHTAIAAELSGMMARVTVTQQFHNPFKDKIEAIYVFPLHQDSAVDAMTMTIGERVVKGLVKERSEAKLIYEAAKAQGKQAALLDQERPNIFTQAVANIEPGKAITITIRYSQTLSWKDGRFEFEVPTVVGPRYIPGSSQAPPGALAEDRKMPSFFSKQVAQRAPRDGPPVANPAPTAPTDQVPDAHRITPPVIEEGYRTGHDLSIRVVLNAGRPILDLRSALHEIAVEHPAGNKSRAIVTLKKKTTLPNRDFAISYRTAGDQISEGVLTHTDERGKFFTLVLQPPARVKQEQVVPRELIFVLDSSGSMSGFPIETSKSLMRRAIANLRPNDSFNLVTFAGHTSLLSSKPLANTAANRNRALRFVDTLRGSGGTEMMSAIDTALGGKHDPKTLRIVCFLTDGYVGNDMAIVAAVRKHARTTRVFSFGIGSSVNRFLLASMARAGLGEAHYVLRPGDARKSADKFYERIDAPVLADIELDFGDLAVEEIFPRRVEDLFSLRPVVVKGRYTRGGEGTIVVRGKNAAGRYERKIPVTLPDENAENAVLAPQWARAKVRDLMMRNMKGLQRGNVRDGVKDSMIELGIEYSLLTQFTSFVAVEERHTTEGGVPRTIQVPLEMPENVSYAGHFGGRSSSMAKVIGSTIPHPGSVQVPSGKSSSAGFGSGDDFGGGWGSGGDGGGGGFGNIPAAMRKRCTKADRLQRLRESGGTEECETAVVETLRWLAKRQNEDGSWCGEDRVTMTGLALLTFLGHCETPLSEEFGEGVTNAILYLVDVANRNKGRLVHGGRNGEPPAGHALATCALAESYNYCKTLQINIPGLQDAVRNAGQDIIDRQAKTGVWTTAATGGGAVSGHLLGGLNLQALQACKRTGLEYRNLRSCVTKALAHLEKLQMPNGALAVGKDAATTDPALTGVAALAFQTWRGAAHQFPRKACKHLATGNPFKWQAASADLYALHFDSRALFNHGASLWSGFNAAFLPELLAAQNEDGSFRDLGGAEQRTRSTVPPVRGQSEIAVHSRSCLAALTLEVYYRYLPNGR